MCAVVGVILVMGVGAGAQGRDGAGWGQPERPAAQAAKTGWGSASASSESPKNVKRVKAMAEPAKQAKAESGTGWGQAPPAVSSAVRRPVAEKAAVAAHAAAPVSRPVRPSPVVVRLEWPEAAPAGRPAGGALLEWGTSPAVAPAAPAVSGTVPPAAAPPAPPAAAATLVAAAMPVAPVAPAAKPEVRKPVLTGLERLSDDWPAWWKVSVQYRGRAEGTDGLAAVKGRDDGYYLNRVRLDSTVVVNPSLRIFAQAQDAQTLGYDLAAQPTSMVNTFDLRQAYFDLQSPTKSGIGVRVGRQELAYGEQRLIGIGEWNNTARTFDAAKGSVFGARGRLDVFAASVVRIEQGRIDRHKTDERLFGAVASLTARAIKGVVEPYIFVKDSDLVTGERGGTGAGRLYATGLRVAGALPHRVDFAAETVLERGTAVTDPIAAWAGHYAMGWTISTSRRKPRVFGEFNLASGDEASQDGRRGTFDQLYPTNHAKYGMVDQVGWRNMRDVMGGFEIMPTTKWKVTSTVHQLWLATTRDGLYNAGGVRTVLNRAATSADIGTELGMATTYAFSKELSFGAGVGYLFAGDFLAQSTNAPSLWAPYVMWNVKF